MNDKIRIGIVGYGNLGKGVVHAVQKCDDMELTAIFTRRAPESLTVPDTDITVVHIDEVEHYTDRIDVMILCGGSATDLPEQTPYFAERFNTIDSYDNHARIPEYFAAVDAPARTGAKTSIISVGWDPGVFSLNRMMMEAILPAGETYTFWGPGVSQGHSDAIRRIEGVVDAVQYTIPIDTAIERVRNGEAPQLTTAEKHRRVCYVAIADGYDPAQIETAITSMPSYFADYDTTVHFVSLAELRADHAKLPHGGFVIHSGTSTNDHTHIIEYALKLDANPEFTASVLVAYARAAHRLHQAGQYGAKTIYDVPPGLLSPKSAEELRRTLL